MSSNTGEIEKAIENMTKNGQEGKEHKEDADYVSIDFPDVISVPHSDEELALAKVFSAAISDDEYVCLSPQEENVIARLKRIYEQLKKEASELDVKERELDAKLISLKAKTQARDDNHLSLDGISNQELSQRLENLRASNAREREELDRVMHTGKTVIQPKIESLQRQLQEENNLIAENARQQYSLTERNNALTTKIDTLKQDLVKLKQKHQTDIKAYQHKYDSYLSQKAKLSEELKSLQAQIEAEKSKQYHPCGKSYKTICQQPHHYQEVIQWMHKKEAVAQVPTRTPDQDVRTKTMLSRRFG